MGDYVYPRSLSDLGESIIFSDFDFEIPDSKVWEIPSCFPSADPPLSNPSALASPFPDAFSFSTVTYTSQAFSSGTDYYIDTLNHRFRMDLRLNFFSFYDLTSKFINVPPYVYLAVPWGITPTPCIYWNSSGPDFDRNVNYYGTVNTSSQSFNIFGKGGQYYSFNTVGDLKALYTYGSETLVSNWVGKAPPESTWAKPSDQCYPYPFGDGIPNPEGATQRGFDSSFTVQLFTAEYIITVYYNGDIQTWRYDILNTTVIQKGNIQYTINNAGTPTPAVTPLPCISRDVPFEFPLGIPANFTAYLGKSIYEDGNLCEIWAENGIVVWWVSGAYPVFIFGPNFPTFMNLKYTRGTPPSEVFRTPSVCVGAFE